MSATVQSPVDGLEAAPVSEWSSDYDYDHDHDHDHEYDHDDTARWDRDALAGRAPSVVRLARLAMLALCLSVLLAATALAQDKRILLLGDSWADYVWKGRVLDQALVRAGLGFAGVEGTDTAVGGTTARGWTDAAMLQRIDRALATHPTIDIVHVSLTGNDLLTQYRASMTAGERAALWSAIRQDLQVVIDHVLTRRPGVQVLICGYDFLNLYDTVLAGNTAAVAMWALLGMPAPAQINSAFLELAHETKALADATPGCEYITNFGLMQSAFGYAPVFAAGQLARPGAVTSAQVAPGGDMQLPSPTASLDVTQGGHHRDPIHLSPQGYGVLMDRAIEQVYRYWLLGQPIPGRASATGAPAGTGGSGSAQPGATAPSAPPSTASPSAASSGAGGCSFAAGQPVGSVWPEIAALLGLLGLSRWERRRARRSPASPHGCSAVVGSARSLRGTNARLASKGF